jgi:L-iditol 2-dehydrogenase
MLSQKRRGKRKPSSKREQHVRAVAGATRAHGTDAMTVFDSTAFVYYAPGDVRVERRRVECGNEDLVVKVQACARCGTDRTIFRVGHPKVDGNAPVILGHELIGEIVAVGRDVRKLRTGIGYKEGGILSDEYLDFKEGERVTVQSRIARYENGLMLLDDPITILSFYIDGGYAHYMRVPRELILSGSVLRVPEGVSDEEAALVEPAACALESLFSTPHAVGADEEGRHLFKAGPREGGSACVIGSGTVSMMYASLLRLLGTAEVVMLVRSEEKVRLVRDVLSDSVKTFVSPPYSDAPLEEKLAIERDLAEKLAAMNHGRLFNDVVTACADPDAQRLMLQLYNTSGYAVGACFGGTHALVDRVNMDSHHYRCATTIGTSGCSTRGMETILRWLRERRLSLRGFTSKIRYSLKTDPAEFLTTSADGLKPVLYPWD